MALPQGFNPNNMSFGNIAKPTPVIEIPRNTASRYNYHESLWSRFNSGVADIGNWFSDKLSEILGCVSVIVMGLLAISALVYVIMTWIEDGFWFALLLTVAIFIVGSLLWYVAIIIIYVVVNVVVYGFRLLFWNGWTLIFALIVAAGVSTYILCDSLINNREENVSVQTYTPTVSKYQCTANTLNVRVSPNSKGRVIGTIKRGQSIDVFGFEGGFAKIYYGGQYAYVSSQYITRVE